MLLGVDRPHRRLGAHDRRQRDVGGLACQRREHVCRAAYDVAADDAPQRSDRRLGDEQGGCGLRVSLLTSRLT